MIALGAGIKAWAITVYGHGTIIEDDEKMVDIKVRHFESVGRHVTVTELRPVATAASKPKLLLWNELTAGEYWAFPVSDFEGQSNEGKQLVRVQDLGDGRFLIDAEYECGYLGKSWARFQFLPRVCPRREDVEFQEVEPPANVQPQGTPKIEPVPVNDDVLMSGVFTVANAQKEWLASTKSVVVSRSQPLINSFLYRIETQAGEPLSKWRSLEALAITEAMATVVPNQQLSEV